MGRVGVALVCTALVSRAARCGVSSISRGCDFASICTQKFCGGFLCHMNRPLSLMLYEPSGASASGLQRAVRRRVVQVLHERRRRAAQHSQRHEIHARTERAGADAQLGDAVVEHHSARARRRSAGTGRCGRTRSRISSRIRIASVLSTNAVLPVAMFVQR